MTNSSTNKFTNNSLLIWILAAAAALGPLAMDIYLPAFPAVVEAFRTTPTIVQFTLTSWLVGLSIGQIVSGPLSDVIGRRIPLNWGLIIFTISSLACALAPNMMVLIILRFIGGFAVAAALVACRAIAADIYEGNKLTKFLATIMIIQGIAPVLAPVVGAQLLLVFTWESTFISMGIFALLVSILSIFYCRETLPKESRISGNMGNIFRVFADLSKSKDFMCICGIQFLVYSTLFAYLSGMPFILQGIYGFTPQQFSLFFAAVGIGMMIFGQLTNILVSRFSNKKLLFIGLCQGVIFSILFCIGLLSNWSLYICLVCLIFTEISLPMIASTSFSLAMEKRRQVAGSASALLGFYTTIAGAIVAPLVSIGGENTAMPTAIIIFICETLALICYFLYLRAQGKN